MTHFQVKKPPETYIFEFSWLRDHAEKIEQLEELQKKSTSEKVIEGLKRAAKLPYLRSQPYTIPERVEKTIIFSRY